jgi:hypothetical protein
MSFIAPSHSYQALSQPPSPTTTKFRYQRLRIRLQIHTEAEQGESVNHGSTNNLEHNFTPLLKALNVPFGVLHAHKPMTRR